LRLNPCLLLPTSVLQKVALMIDFAFENVSDRLVVCFAEAVITHDS
jgi:hypothetical protein